MKLETVEFTTIESARDEARRQFLVYRKAVREAKDADQKKADAIVMRGYREIAKGRPVLDLMKVMQGAGIREDNWYPKLAICNADATHCCVEMRESGGVTFYAGRSARAPKNRRVALPASTLPTFQRDWTGKSLHTSTRRNWSAWSPEAEAVVPTIPPQYRPPFQLGNYHLLWEAVWTKAVPEDPILLRHLGGNLFAVLAQWDLSPLEQAVLRGRL